MSDALLSGSQAAGPKLAAVWQPAPVLKALANQRFVRVKDARGHTSHFTLSSYQHLSQEALGLAKPNGNGKQGSQANPVSQGATPAGPGTGAAPEEQQAPSLDALSQEAVEAIRKEAYASGLADGRQEQILEREAQKKASEAEQREQEAQQTQALLQKIQESIVGLYDQPDALYEPIKRLALHLAEQLVLAELSLSPAVIQGLVQRSLDTLELPASAQVVVDLNPDDLALLQGSLNDDNMPAWQLQADPSLQPGSVRVSADDATVSDLVENRLAGIAASLLKQPQRAQAQSAFSPQNLQLRKASADVQEVLPQASYERFQAPARATEPSPRSDAESELMPMPSPEPQTSDRPQFMNEVLVAPEAAPMPAFDFPLSQDDLSLGQAAPPEEANPKAEGQPHDD